MWVTHEFEILEVGYNFFGISLSALFESFDLTGICLGEFCLDCLHVSLFRN